jgi:hypothetical protein
MYDLQIVNDKIKKILMPLLKSGLFDNFEGWLDKMTNGSNEDKRFLCCLAMELENEIVDPLAYAGLFDSLQVNETIATQQIEDYLADNHNKHFYSNVVCKEKIAYVRVMQLSTFLEYFINRSDINDVVTKNDQSNVIREIKRGILKNILMPNDGPPFRGVAWILPKSEYIDICSSIKGENKNLADEIVRVLGIKCNLENTHYIKINYPEDFDEETYQPCTINAKFEEDCLFLSYKKDDSFGRTRSLDSDDKKQRKKERIHKPLPDKYRYHIEYLGEITQPNTYSGNIVEDAYNRLFE